MALQLVLLLLIIGKRKLVLMSFTETKALEEGVSPAELCVKYHALHKGIYDCKDLNVIYGWQCR